MTNLFDCIADRDTRCVTHLTPYLGPRAKGYCAIRHKHTTGTWPGNHHH
ncbi:hypothetical protein [Corynebacterium kefirresidentii]